MERSGSEPWRETLCWVLGQETVLSQCLSSPRCIPGHPEKSKISNLMITELFIHIFLIGTVVPFNIIQEDSGLYTSLFLDTD